jgi:hypothetical protein
MEEGLNWDSLNEEEGKVQCNYFHPWIILGWDYFPSLSKNNIDRFLFNPRSTLIIESINHIAPSSININTAHTLSL